VDYLTEAACRGKVFLKEKERIDLLMPFPEAERQVYELNPLAEVIAQLRYDPILIVDSQTPAQFQEAIRHELPVYRVSDTLPPGMPQPVQRIFREMGAPDTFRQHTFASQDSRWEIILTRESLVLKSKSYGGWFDFQNRLQRIQQAFEHAYRPAGTYVSVNLRYVDVFQRSKLDLNGVPWSELLRPEVAGELASDLIGEEIDKMSNSLHCPLDNEGSFLTLKTSLALSKDGRREKCFVLDSDFHTHSRAETQDVQPIFHRFNRHSRNLFQWTIKDRLRRALRPVREERQRQ
jgi:uncharacterized protein (TIGR04255 family)